MKKPIIFLSLLSAAVIAIPIFFVFMLIAPEHTIPLTLITTLSFCLALVTYMLIHMKVIGGKIQKAEAAIKSPVICKINGNFMHGKLLKNGNLYFCNSEILLLSVDGRQYRSQLSRDALDRIEVEHIHIIVFAKDGLWLEFVCRNPREAMAELDPEEWNICYRTK